MKVKMVIATLICGMAFCSSTNGHDLLNRLMGRSCGGCATSCCDTPAVADCGCDTGCGLDFNVHVRFSLGCPKFGNFFNRGCGGCGLLGGGLHGGCDTGCDTGCDSGCGGGLLRGCHRGCGGGGLIGGGCGCDTGCDSGCDSGCGGCGTGLLAGLFQGRGCGHLFHRHHHGCGGCGGGLIGGGCGCDTGCDTGCNDGCGFRFGRLGLFNRGCGGCDTGCGAVADPGCGCNGGAAPAPAGGVPATDAPQVIEPNAAPQADAPVVDPNAFIVPNRRIAGGAR